MTASSPPPLPLQIPSYHRAMAALLRGQEPGVWRWLEGTQSGKEHYAACRLELLKSTVRLDPEGQPQLYAALFELLAQLGHAVPATIYQSQSDGRGEGQTNAALVYVPGEVHIILSGPLLTLLSAAEVRVVLAHELAHFVLLECEGGAYQTAARLVEMSAAHPDAKSVHFNSARSWSLHTEIFADRVALQLTSDLHLNVASLVKIHTGVNQVHAASYLRQAEEILQGAAVRTAGFSHPELFIRARALQLFDEQGADSESSVSDLVKLGQDLDSLDWLDQQYFTALTHRFWRGLLALPWLRTPAVSAHARLFFPELTDDELGGQPLDADFWVETRSLGLPLREYFLWQMADLIAIERDLEDMPVLLTLEVADRLDAIETAEQILKREFKMTVRELKKFKKNAPVALAAAGGTL